MDAILRLLPSVVIDPDIRETGVAGPRHFERLRHRPRLLRSVKFVNGEFDQTMRSNGAEPFGGLATLLVAGLRRLIIITELAFKNRDVLSKLDNLFSARLGFLI